MLLSEAMRRGVEQTTPLHNGETFAWDAQVQVVSACALGAAYLGACGNITRPTLIAAVYGDASCPPSSYFPQLVTDWIVAQLKEVIALDLYDRFMMPDLYGTDRDSERLMRLESWIWRANDLRQWQREQIVDALAARGL